MLFIAVPPRISPFSFEDGITEGLRTQLMCSSSQGDQPFNITWLKDQRIIYTRLKKQQNDEKHLDMDFTALRNEHPSSYFIDNTIHINEYAPFSSILSIENLTSHHNGNYTCRISNQGGVVDHTAVLSVAGSYRIFTKIEFSFFFLTQWHNFEWTSHIIKFTIFLKLIKFTFSTHTQKPMTTAQNDEKIKICNAQILLFVSDVTICFITDKSTY